MIKIKFDTFSPFGEDLNLCQQFNSRQKKTDYEICISKTGSLPIFMIGNPEKPTIKIKLLAFNMLAVPFSQPSALSSEVLRS